MTDFKTSNQPSNCPMERTVFLNLDCERDYGTAINENDLMSELYGNKTEFLGRDQECLHASRQRTPARKARDPHSIDTNTDPLDIVIITVREYYYIPKFLQGVIESDAVNIKKIVTIPPALGKKNSIQFTVDMLRLFGLRVFAKHVGFYLKYILIDRLNRYTNRGKSYSVRTIAARNNIDHKHVTNVNDEPFIKELREKEFDVLVSVAATQKFDRELIATPDRCAVNIHSSLLPKYRGVAPSFWTLLNDEDRTGITVHHIDENIDTGDIIIQSPIPIRDDDTLHSLNKRVAEHGSEVLVDALEQIRFRSATRTPINPDEGSYYSVPEREDIRRFLEQGKSFY